MLTRLPDLVVWGPEPYALLREWTPHPPGRPLGIGRVLAKALLLRAEQRTEADRAAAFRGPGSEAEDGQSHR